MSSPWFKFYASDFLAGTSGLTAAERGVYITLLALMYEREGPVPLNASRLARYCGVPAGSFKRILNALIDEGKIIKEGDSLYNSKAESIIGDRKKEITGRQSGAHKTNAILKEKRQEKQCKAERSPSRSESAIPEPDNKKINKKPKSIDDPQFVEWWELFGSKARGNCSKTKAADKFRIVASKVGAVDLIKATKDYIRSTDQRYQKNPFSWLNDERYRHFLEQAQKVTRIEERRPATPEWQRKGYRSEQHWIECGHGKIAPNAKEPVFFKGDVAERLVI